MLEYAIHQMSGAIERKVVAGVELAGQTLTTKGTTFAVHNITSVRAEVWVSEDDVIDAAFALGLILLGSIGLIAAACTMIVVPFVLNTMPRGATTVPPFPWGDVLVLESLLAAGAFLAWLMFMWGLRKKKNTKGQPCLTIVTNDGYPFRVTYPDMQYALQARAAVVEAMGQTQRASVAVDARSVHIHRDQLPPHSSR